MITVLYIFILTENGPPFRAVQRELECNQQLTDGVCFCGDGNGLAVDGNIGIHFISHQVRGYGPDGRFSEVQRDWIIPTRSFIKAHADGIDFLVPAAARSHNADYVNRRAALLVPNILLVQPFDK